MEQSHTNAHEIMNYLNCLHLNPELEECTTGRHLSRPLRADPDTDQQTPDRSVIRNIMNYARALDAFKTRDGQTIFMLGN